MRSVHYTAPSRLDGAGGLVDVRHLHVGEPVGWCGSPGSLEHAGHLPSAVNDQLVDAHFRAHVVGGSLLPAEQLDVEVDRGIEVGRAQLMPGEISGLSRRRGAIRRAGRGRVQRESGPLRIGHHGKPTDVGNVRGALENLAAQTLHVLDGRIDAWGTDIEEPVRRRTRGLLGQSHQAASLGLTGVPQCVAGHARGLGLPRDHLRIEGAGGFSVRRHQLVPDESSPNIRVAHGENSPFFGPLFAS